MEDRTSCFQSQASQPLYLASGSTSNLYVLTKFGTFSPSPSPSLSLSFNTLLLTSSLPSSYYFASTISFVTFSSSLANALNLLTIPTTLSSPFTSTAAASISRITTKRYLALFALYPSLYTTTKRSIIPITKPILRIGLSGRKRLVVARKLRVVKVKVPRIIIRASAKGPVISIRCKGLVR